jgi:hypothetical protein
MVDPTARALATGAELGRIREKSHLQRALVSFFRVIAEWRSVIVRFCHLGMGVVGCLLLKHYTDRIDTM